MVGYNDTIEDQIGVLVAERDALVEEYETDWMHQEDPLPILRKITRLDEEVRFLESLLPSKKSRRRSIRLT